MIREWMICLLIATSCLAGCNQSDGPATFEVQGSVSYRQKKLPSGMVIFRPNQGKQITAAIQPDGSYQLEAPEGHYLVGVVAPAEIPEGVDPWGKNFVAQPPLVPARFGHPSKSGLTAEVKSDSSNVANIEIVKSAQKTQKKRR